MASISIPNSFSDGDAVDGDKLQENFEAVTLELDDDNFEQIRESAITFSVHDHSGGTNGAVISGDDLDGELSHSDFPAAVENAAEKGALLFESGEVELTGGHGVDIGTSVITLSNITKIAAMPFVYYPLYYNRTDFFGDHFSYYYYIDQITDSSFRIVNNTGLTCTFKWFCVGI